MKNKESGARGFTLLELLVVISIIAILSAALFTTIGKVRENSLKMHARKTMDTLTMALEKYKSDFNEYPPDNTPSTNGSDLVWYYLCRRLSVGETHYGPYLEVKDNQLADATSGGGGSNAKKFLSPLGGEYKYGLIIDSDGQKRNYVLVDPGRDKHLGGSFNATTGFTVEDTKAAGDNIFDPQTAALMKLKGIGQ